MTPDVSLLLELFGDVPHVMVCVKGADGRYVAANTAFVTRVRGTHVRDVVGRRAHDLFPADLASSYDAQDRAVLLTGRPFVNVVEPIEDRTGERRWYLTTKVRHATEHGVVVAAVSVETRLDGGAASGCRPRSRWRTRMPPRASAWDSSPTPPG